MGLTVAVVDIGRPESNLGWALSGPTSSEGTHIDECVEHVAQAALKGPVALGFEAPMFVPCRTDPKKLTAARRGECGGGYPNRPFSAGAGAAVTVTALVVVPYILHGLRCLLPGATAWVDWGKMPGNPGELLLFEAFVTNQGGTASTRHIDDAKSAIIGFWKAIAGQGVAASAIEDDVCLSLVGAMMLRTGWTNDIAVLSEPCLVVRG